MKRGSILGYDMNDKYCQISYYDENKNEPVTLQVAANNYQIPLVIGYYNDRWVYGKEAKRLSVLGNDNTVTNLFDKAIHREKCYLNERSYDAVWLLAKYVALSLRGFNEIEHITFTTPYTDVDMSKLFKGIGQHLGIPKTSVSVQDYKESFCNYMLFQPKELWQYEAASFYCDDRMIKAYMLRKMNTRSRYDNTFVTVDEVANAKVEEWEALYPVMNLEKAKSADENFKSLIENIFDKKIISSVYLSGDGFENNWYPESLKVLTNGRRAFIGNNLYSNGACYCAARTYVGEKEGPIYLDESKLLQRICLRMRADGQEGWYPIVSWGSHWYEADGQWEMLVNDLSSMDVMIESLEGDESRVEEISLKGLPDRKDYSVRLQAEIMFIDQRTCVLTVKDIGFGEFYPASDFKVEKEIHLGGTNGQFNPM